MWSYCIRLVCRSRWGHSAFHWWKLLWNGVKTDMISLLKCDIIAYSYHSSDLSFIFICPNVIPPFMLQWSSGQSSWLHRGPGSIPGATRFSEKCADITLYPQTLALTSPTNGGRSVCIVRSRIKAAEIVFLVGLERGYHSASWVQLRSYLEEKVAAPVYKTEITAVGDAPRWLRDTPLSAKIGSNFADKRRSLGLYSRSRTKASSYVT
jgi:hypothetical protein